MVDFCLIKGRLYGKPTDAWFCKYVYKFHNLVVVHYNCQLLANIYLKGYSLIPQLTIMKLLMIYNTAHLHPMTLLHVHDKHFCWMRSLYRCRLGKFLTSIIHNWTANSFEWHIMKKPSLYKSCEACIIQWLEPVYTFWNGHYIIIESVNILSSIRINWICEDNDS